MPVLPDDNPPPLTVAGSLVAVQGACLLVAAVAELVSVQSDRVSIAISTGAFFAAYAALLLVAAWALVQRRPWARGPVLLTQLILLGLAWNLRDAAVVAVALALVALLTLAGLLHPASIAALTPDDPD